MFWNVNRPECLADDWLFFKHQFADGVTRHREAAQLSNAGWHASTRVVIRKLVVTSHLQTSAAVYARQSVLRSK